MSPRQGARWHSEQRVGQLRRPAKAPVDLSKETTVVYDPNGETRRQQGCRCLITDNLPRDHPKQYLMNFGMSCSQRITHKTMTYIGLGPRDRVISLRPVGVMPFVYCMIRFIVQGVPHVPLYIE